MESLFTVLKRLFRIVDGAENTFSLRWDKQVNKRTVLIIVALGIIAMVTYVNVIEPPDAFPVDELVTVPSGEPISLIAKELQSQGVIRSPLAFRILVRLYGYERGARAGDYIFKEPVPVWDVARAVSLGVF